MKRETTKEERYAVVYQTYVNQVYRIFLYFLGNEEMAQELCVRVFREFYEYFEEVAPEKMEHCLILMAKEMLNSR